MTAYKVLKRLRFNSYIVMNILYKVTVKPSEALQTVRFYDVRFQFSIYDLNRWINVICHAIYVDVIYPVIYVDGIYPLFYRRAMFPYLTCL